MTLFKQHAKTELISTLIWAVVLGLLGFFTTYMWEFMRSSGSLSDLQKALENAQGIVKTLVGSGGASMLTLDGWIQGYSLGGWVSLLYAIFTGLFVAGIITREMDRRSMEFLLSLPVSRAELLVSRWSVLAGSLVVLHLAHVAGVLTGVAALGAEGHVGRYALAALNSLLLYLFLGGLMLLVSLFIDDYGACTGAMLGVGLGLNFAYLGTADSSGALKTFHDVLPFSLYDVQSIIMKGDVPYGDMAILAVGAVLLLAASVWVFQRKQIAV